MPKNCASRIAHLGHSERCSRCMLCMSFQDAELPAADGGKCLEFFMMLASGQLLQQSSPSLIRESVSCKCCLYNLLILTGQQDLHDARTGHSQRSHDSAARNAPNWMAIKTDVVPVVQAPCFIFVDGYIFWDDHEYAPLAKQEEILQSAISDYLKPAPCGHPHANMSPVPNPRDRVFQLAPAAHWRHVCVSTIWVVPLSGEQSRRAAEKRNPGRRFNIPNDSPHIRSLLGHLHPSLLPCRISVSAKSVKGLYDLLQLLCLVFLFRVLLAGQLPVALSLFLLGSIPRNSQHLTRFVQLFLRHIHRRAGQQWPVPGP
mmetsp:Transcript_62556/g.118370  ORF Transcript_62556/g.118370 Transcript_62556/m.118370 type:complete len:315 (-) Transcript_62556:26-970(-)